MQCQHPTWTSPDTACPSCGLAFEDLELELRLTTEYAMHRRLNGLCPSLSQSVLLERCERICQEGAGTVLCKPMTPWLE